MKKVQINVSDIDQPQILKIGDVLKMNKQRISSLKRHFMAYLEGLRLVAEEEVGTLKGQTIVTTAFDRVLARTNGLHQLFLTEVMIEYFMQLTY